MNITIEQIKQKLMDIYVDSDNSFTDMAKYVQSMLIEAKIEGLNLARPYQMTTSIGREFSDHYNNEIDKRIADLRKDSLK